MEETTAPKHANEHPLSNNSDGAMVTQGSLASRLGSGGSGDDDNDHGSHLRDVVFSADDMVRTIVVCVCAWVYKCTGVELKCSCFEALFYLRTFIHMCVLRRYYFKTHSM
jgi:hypothetical protein